MLKIAQIIVVALLVHAHAASAQTMSRSEAVSYCTKQGYHVGTSSYSECVVRQMPQTHANLMKEQQCSVLVNEYMRLERLYETIQGRSFSNPGLSVHLIQVSDQLTRVQLKKIELGC